MEWANLSCFTDLSDVVDSNVTLGRTDSLKLFNSLVFVPKYSAKRSLANHRMGTLALNGCATTTKKRNDQGCASANVSLCGATG